MLGHPVRVVGCCEVGAGVWKAGAVPFKDDLQSGRGGLAGDDWWRSAVIYQIYPRSFADSGGDGVGDLPGITGRLDYLVDLGVDAVWLSPFYASPMVDFGYDITDHCVVDPVFGTLAAFDGLLAAISG